MDNNTNLVLVVFRAVPLLKAQLPIIGWDLDRTPLLPLAASKWLNTNPDVHIALLDTQEHDVLTLDGLRFLTRAAWEASL